MNNFRKLHYIDYKGSKHIRVNKALLNVVLYDRPPHQGANRPVVIDREEPATDERKCVRAG